MIWGRIYDKLGFWGSVIPSLLLLAAGYVVLSFFTSTLPVFLGSLMMMCGYLSGMAVFGAVIRDHTPENRAGMFQGLRIVSQVLIPGIIGPAIGAYVLRNAATVTNDDGTVSFVPNRSIFLSALLIVGILALFLALVFAVVKRGKQDEK